MDRRNHYRTLYCAGCGQNAPPEPSALLDTGSDLPTEVTPGTGTSTGVEVTLHTSMATEVTPGTGTSTCTDIDLVPTETDKGVATGTESDALQVPLKPMTPGMLLPMICLNAVARAKVDRAAVGVPSSQYPGLASNWCVSAVAEGTSKLANGDLVPCRLVGLSYVSQWVGCPNTFGRRFLVFPLFLNPEPGDENFLDQQIFAVAHSSIDNGIITSEDPGMTAFGMTEQQFAHEQSRVSSEISTDPKYGQSIPQTDNVNEVQIPASQSPVATSSTRQLRARNICAAGKDCVVVGNGETHPCDSGVHSNVPSFHLACPPLGEFDANGNWLCMDNRSCQQEMKKRGRLAVVREKALKDKAKDKADRERVQKMTQKPASLPAATVGRFESSSLADIKNIVSSTVFTSVQAAILSQQAEVHQTAPASAPVAGEDGFLQLQRLWRVQDDARQDRRDQEARLYNTAQGLQHADTTLRVLASVGHGAFYHGAPPSPLAPHFSTAHVEKQRKSKDGKTSKKHKKNKKRSRVELEKESKKQKAETDKKSKKKKKKKKKKRAAETSSSGTSTNSSSSSSSSSSSDSDN